jgi:hypothetical protein
MSSLQPYVLSTALCPLLRPYVPFYSPMSPSTALCPLLRPYVPFYGPMSPSTALCPLLRPYVRLYDPLPPQRPPIPSMALCLLYSPLSSLLLSISSTALFHSMALCSI